jgi:hypothetical protein
MAIPCSSRTSRRTLSPSRIETSALPHRRKPFQCSRRISRSSWTTSRAKGPRCWARRGACTLEPLPRWPSACGLGALPLMFIHMRPDALAQKRRAHQPAIEACLLRLPLIFWAPVPRSDPCFSEDQQGPKQRRVMALL